MRIVGIDLSMTSTGLCYVKDGKIAALGTLVSKGGRSDSIERRRDRLWGLANEVFDWAAEYHPDVVVIEAPSYGSQYGSAHDRAGLWWMVAGPLSHHFTLTQVSPQGRAKYGTGAGNSAKRVVHSFVVENYSDLCPRRIKNNDEADAILLASMASRYYGEAVEDWELGEANLASLTGVLWPSV